MHRSYAPCPSLGRGRGLRVVYDVASSRRVGQLVGLHREALTQRVQRVRPVVEPPQCGASWTPWARAETPNRQCPSPIHFSSTPNLAQCSLSFHPQPTPHPCTPPHSFTHLEATGEEWTTSTSVLLPGTPLKSYPNPNTPTPTHLDATGEGWNTSTSMPCPCPTHRCPALHLSCSHP